MRTTILNGSVQTQVFLAVAASIALYYFLVPDWSKARLQSPITFISEQQPRISLAAFKAAGSAPDSLRIATASPAQFDLRAIAAAEHIELQPEDLSADQARQAYIRRFGPVAIAEMKAYGVPASITLAQGLLESKAGQSRLATQNNNHFGIKCFSKTCKRGHCTNFPDDTHKDFFVRYPSAWASFRAHSKLLSGGRYRSLIGQDYTGWARGLDRLGYATANHYDQQLIRLIRLYGLDRLDRI